MKIRNLSPIRFAIILLALLCFAILAACPSEKKEADIEKKTEEIPMRIEQQGMPKLYTEPTLIWVYKFTVVNENNVQIYSKSDNGYVSLEYLQKGDKIRLNLESIEEIEINGTSDFLYHFSEVIDSESTAQGWVQKKYLDIISIQQDRTVTLTNSKTVNPELFPVIIDHFQEYVGLYGPPNYLESEDDWVVFTDDRRNNGEHGLTLHLKNLPLEFDVLIYTPDESSCLTFSGEREEFNIEEYKDLFIPEQREPLERILPMYTFYYPAPFTAFPGKQKTEIRGKDNTLIFFTYLDYPDDSFRIERIRPRSFLVKYFTNKPFYLVVYEAVKEDILDFSDKGIERTPVGAFAVYPETNIWEGILDLKDGFGKMEMYRIYLYRIDKNNPEDYTQEIKGPWNNFIDID